MKKTIPILLCLLCLCGCTSGKYKKLDSYEGKEANVAIEYFDKEKLNYTVKEQYSEDVKKGIVMSQNVAEENGKNMIYLVVSNGYNPVKIDNLYGTQEDDAIAKLEELAEKYHNFSYKIEYLESCDKKEATVAKQSIVNKTITEPTTVIYTIYKPIECAVEKPTSNKTSTTTTTKKPSTTTTKKPSTTTTTKPSNGSSTSSTNKPTSPSTPTNTKIQITYDSNGGISANMGQYVKMNAYFNLSASKMYKTGYTQKYWNTAADGSGRSYRLGQMAIFKEDTTLYAKYEPNAYTLRFDNNGGNGTIANVAMVYDVEKELPENTYEGAKYTVIYNMNYAGNKAENLVEYSFVNWNTEKDGTGTSYKDGATVKNLTSGTAPVTLYAQWIQSEEVALNPVRPGYKFEGWYSDAACTKKVANAGDKLTIIENTTLYAKWTPITYTLTLSGTDIGASIGQNCKFNETVSLTNTFTKEGYTFKEWNTKADGSGTKYSEGALVKELTTEDGAEVTLYAQWEPISYTVKFDGNGATNTTLENIIAKYDEEFELPENPFTLDGYVFDGWNTEADGSGTTYASTESVKNLSKTANEEITLYAKWKVPPVKYTISINANGGTIDDEEVKTINAEVGQEYEFSIPSKYGYLFKGWTVSKELSDDQYSKNEIILNTEPYVGVVYSGTYKVKDLNENPDDVITFTAQWEPCKYRIVYSDMVSDLKYVDMVYDGSAWDSLRFTGGNLIYGGVDENSRFTFRQGIVIYNAGTEGIYYNDTDTNSINKIENVLSEVDDVDGVLRPKNEISGEYMYPVLNNDLNGAIAYNNLLNYEKQLDILNKVANGEEFDETEKDVYIFPVFNDIVKPTQKGSIQYFVGESEITVDENTAIDGPVSVKISLYDGFTGIKRVSYHRTQSIVDAEDVEVEYEELEATVDAASEPNLFYSSVDNKILVLTGPTNYTYSVDISEKSEPIDYLYFEVEDYAGNKDIFPFRVDFLN